MKPGDITIRLMHAGDTTAAWQLSENEGWNQTEQDWKFFIDNPDNICLAAIHEYKLIGTTIGVGYGVNLAWISMVLVDRSIRRQGISKLLLDSVLAQLTHVQSIKLDASPFGHPIYRKYGFEDDFTILRMVRAPGSSDDSSKTEWPQLSLISPLDKIPTQELIDLDQAVFGAPRPRLIQYLVSQSPGSCGIYKDDVLLGFGLSRKGHRYYQVGPVIADRTEAARMLICKLIEVKQELPIVVDVPDSKTDLIHWLGSIGFKEKWRFVRMLKNESSTWRTENDKTFVIAGPEFG